MPSPKLRILVTGDTGTIGWYLVRELRRRGHEVFGCSRRHVPDEKHLRADVRDYRQLERVFRQVEPTVVYHLAAEFGRHNGDMFYEQCWDTNVIGVENVALLCAEFGATLIFASSSEAYGEIDLGDDFIREEYLSTQPIHHLNSYAMSKWCGEHIILNAQRKFDLQAVRLRFFNVYGPGEFYHPYRSVVCLFCYRALHGLPYEVYDGYHRVFQFVGDFIPTVANVCECIDPPTSLAINIGGEEYCSVDSMSAKVLSLVGVTEGDLHIRHIAKDEHNVVNKRPDNTLAKGLLSHNPSTPLSIGLKATLAWMTNIYANTIVHPPAFLKECTCEGEYQLPVLQETVAKNTNSETKETVDNVGF